MPTLSLCMIVKNEEQFLDQCLSSVQDLVDEIVIVDTGSTDKTKEIAENFSHAHPNIVFKMVDFVWNDDFSAARNESLKHASGDWILVLDADEVLAAKDCLKVKEAISKAGEDVMGCILNQRNYIRSKSDLHYNSFADLKVYGTNEAGAGFVSSKEDKYKESFGTAGWLPTPIVRLFRNIKGVYFHGRVHEQINSSLQECGQLLNLDLPIHHFGKLDMDSWKKKGLIYEKLAEKKAMEEHLDEEKSDQAYFELGRQYLANKKLDQAKEMFEKVISINNNHWLSWLNLGSIYLIANDLQQALVCLERAALLNPHFPNIYANLGVVHAKMKNFDLAIKMFVLGLKLDDKRADIFKNMGMCYKEMGDGRRAVLAFRKAVELNPEYAKIVQFEKTNTI